MKPKTVAIVGFGAVGRSIKEQFPQAVAFDEPLGIGSRDEVNRCEYAFVSVPTPMAADASCDTSIVEGVIDWIESDYIIIRSTVGVGTTERLVAQTGKNIVFQPAYGPAETPDHPFNDPRNIRWLILGGDRKNTSAVANLYKTTYNSELVIHQTDSRSAELAKYMENCFLALKVTFCNEFFDIAERVGVDYDELRELWLLDPRIGRSHTFVFPDDRGFGGKCLPKDVNAVVALAKEHRYDADLLQATLRANDKMRETQFLEALPTRLHGRA
jgi:UDPglucose 6-dehydrogenase